MPSKPKWILTKGTEFRPTGTLQVGQILAKPLDPSNSLMPGGPLPIPKDILQEESFHTSVDINSKDVLGAMFGLWGSVAELPVGAKVGANINRSDELSWQFEKLSGKIISPSLAYIKDALKHGDVPSYIKRFHFKRRIFMVSGVKTAHGAKMTKKGSQSMELHGSVKADLTQVGAPVTTGVEAKYSQSSSDAESFKGASDFVYAYRLEQINYKGEPTHKPRGIGKHSANFSADSSSDDSDEEDSDTNDSDDEDFDLELDVKGLKGDIHPKCFKGATKFRLDSTQDTNTEYEIFLATGP